MKPLGQHPALSGMISRGNLLLVTGGGLALLLIFIFTALTSSPEERERVAEGTPVGTVQASEIRSEELHQVVEQELVAAVDPQANPAGASAEELALEPQKSTSTPPATLNVEAAQPAPKLQYLPNKAGGGHKVRPEELSQKKKRKKKAARGDESTDPALQAQRPRAKGAAGEKSTAHPKRAGKKFPGTPVRKHLKKRKQPEPAEQGAPG